MNFLGTANNQFYLTGVQVEKGTIATPFEFRPYGVELQLCQRYVLQLSFAFQALGYVRNASWFHFNVQFPVQMRIGVIPTLSGSGNISYGGSDVGFSSFTTPGGTTPTTLSGGVFAVASGMPLGYGGILTLNTNSYIRFDADL